MIPRVLLGLLGAVAISHSVLAADWFSRGHGRAPEGARIYVCHGYGCRIVTPVELGIAEIERITAPFQPAPVDAAAERDALARAIQVYEVVIGEHAGTSNDLAATQVGRSRADQMDCIDEATNTTSLLRFLAQQGLLKLHEPQQPASRGFFLDGRYPHATAVVSVHESGEKWALDSWPNANGEAPVVQPLAQWRTSRR